MNKFPAKVLLLGSTGSIGTSTLNCIRRFADRFSIAGLAAGRNLRLFSEQIREFRPESVYIAESKDAERLGSEFGGIRVYTGAEGLVELVKQTECDIVLNALVGAVGFRPTIAALEANRRVALANKESLVMGGDLICQMIGSGKGELLPVDSEHSAILQCLNGAQSSTIESIILTASGGPFRNLAKEDFAFITPEQALNHPTWSMGKKITIDSATLMNKGFEVIEAHHLFSLSYSKLKVLIHPQSIIHSMVEFHDGAVLAQLGVPDMELPIQYALSYPQRFPISGKRLSLAEIGSLDFAEPDFDRFPCLRLCLEAGEMGGTAPAVVNAANEIAVGAFLENKIKFCEIAQIVAYALRTHKNAPADSVETIQETDKVTRQRILKNLLSKGEM
ncbi:MAG TPA: 1-deoxy-D-xylulose-5-phosphate reductoisomerase [Chitinispirillaceae bacterium]|nr:1-deoxy-D-xylulose-5-phosphate reductoisomerase [Chitinispirillaceae bacterium]